MRSGRIQPSTENGLVPRRYEHGKGTPKESNDDRGGDQTNQEKMEHATEITPLCRNTARGCRARFYFGEHKPLRLRLDL